MTKKAAEAAAPKEKQKPDTGLVFELEFMLFPGRQLMFAAFESALKASQASLDKSMFSRYCRCRNVLKCLQSLLPAIGKKNLPAEELADTIKSRFEKSLFADDCRPSEGLVSLATRAAEAGFKLGVLSFLPREQAEQLAARLPFSPPAALHAMKKDADVLPSPDSWLSLLKVIPVIPRSAIAVVNSAQACKSALAVGMRCIAIPDEFTHWQDFSGADLFAENIADIKASQLPALLTTAHFAGRAK